MTSGTGRKETVCVPRENTATLKIIPFAVRSVTKVGGSGNSDLRYGALLLPLLFPNVLELGVLVPKSASPGLGFSSSFPVLEISER